MPETNFAQAPNLGSAASFVLFSAVGAVGNTGISHITGNVGTNTGAITTFGNVDGGMHNADAATAQAAIDLQIAVQFLLDIPAVNFVGPVLGSGQVLFAGVDTITGAGSISGLLILDAQGDSNALFIIKIGGALTSSASATVSLVNGALACNVFWITKGGAISLATLTNMKGTLIANPGAVDLGAGCKLDGRAFSTTGAVTVNGTTARMPLGCSTPVLTGPLALVLNSTRCFALFSSSGMIANAGVTHIAGDIGSNGGSTSGYDPLLITGIIHASPDASTAQCDLDFQVLYAYLNSLPYDIELLYPAQLGNKLTLTPHVYRMNAAAVLSDTLYRDAEGNPDAVFVIQINGGLTTSTYAKVGLINGASAANVYWVAQGPVTINDYSIFCGTIVANNGTIDLNTAVMLNGKAFATTGDLNTTSTNVDNSFGGGCTLLPLKISSFTGICDKGNNVLSRTAPAEHYPGSFTIERSADGTNWMVAGTVKASVSSSPNTTYSFIDHEQGEAMYYYRLSETDLAGNINYGNIITVPKCDNGIAEQLSIYPNPSSGKFLVNYTGDPANVYATQIYDALGEKIYDAKGFRSKFDLSANSSGVYYLVFKLKGKTSTLKFIILE